jgi:hypothetical protein
MNHIAPTDSIAVNNLTEADLQRDPVWQFKMESEGEDGVDESHASPNPAGLRIGSFGSFIVRATYVLQTGQELPGAVQVDLLGPKVFFSPAFLCVQGKQLDPDAPDLETRLTRITKIAGGRPKSWRLSVPFAGESKPRTGRIAQSRFIQAAGVFWQLVRLRFSRRGHRQ